MLLHGTNNFYYKESYFMGRPISKLESIENSAIKLFAEKGINGTSIREIAIEAGCSDGALYKHYKSKDEMAWILYKREVEAFGKNLKHIYDSQESYEGKLYTGIGVFYKFYDDHPVKYNFIVLSQHSFPREYLVEDSLNPYFLLSNLLNQGIDANMIRVEDIQLTVALLYGLILQPTMLKATNRLDGKMQDKTEAVFKACIKILTG